MMAAKAILKTYGRQIVFLGGVMFDFFNARQLKKERDEARLLCSEYLTTIADKSHELERLSKLNRTYAESARRALDLLTAVSDVASSYSPDAVEKLQNNKSLKSKLSEAQRVIETVSKVSKSEGS